MSEPVAVVRHEGVLHVVLDAPQRRNALSRPMLAAVSAALTDVCGDVTGVVLSGRGDAFSAGADFRELTGTSADLEYDDAVAAVTTAIRDLPLVVVAAVEGPCVGAAADLALSCDLRVAAQGGYLQVPAVRLGLLYNPAAVERLRGSYPRDTVRRLLLLGERFSSDEALRAGLVSRVVPRGEAVKRAVDLLADITTDELDAIAATKSLLNAQEAGAFDPAHWAKRRRQQLDSPARRAAVERAKRAHIEKESRETDE